MPKNIKLDDALKSRFDKAAKRAGYSIALAGPGSERGDFLAALLDAWDERGQIAGKSAPEVWARFWTRLLPAMGELSAALLAHGCGLTSHIDAEKGSACIEQVMLE